MPHPPVTKVDSNVLVPDLEGKVAVVEILRSFLCSSLTACLIAAKILTSRHMDLGRVAQDENVSTLTECVQHLANANRSMKVCSPFLGRGTSTWQEKTSSQEGNGS